MRKTITTRSSTGTVKQIVELVHFEYRGLRRSHNRDGSFERLVGWDANGTKYETSSRRGWRRAPDQTGGEA